MMHEYRRHSKASTNRPQFQDGEVHRIQIVDSVLPGEFGTGNPVWADDRTDGDTVATFAPVDGSNPNRQFTVHDVNRCNCLLYQELAWCRYDADTGYFVPVGSQGLTRMAIADEHAAPSTDIPIETTDVFDASFSKLGERLVDKDDADITLEVQSNQGASKGEEFWVQWSISELDIVTTPAPAEILREGKWKVLARKGLAFVMAPSGGIPARVLATPGKADCDIVVIAEEAGTGYAAGDFVKLSDQIEVRNWTFDIAAEEGDRVLQVEGYFDGAFVVGWSCTNAGNTNDIKVP